jgi:SAM-dependent methyltransferase
MTFGVASVLDLPDEWTNKFDFVHQRLLVAALKCDEWAIAIREIFRATKPGGFAELCECTPLKTGCGPYSRRYLDGYREVMKHYDMDFDIVYRIPGLLLEAGFVDVHAEARIVKFGPAGGEDGRRIALTQAGVARGIGGPLAMAGGLGVVSNQNEWEALIDEVEKEWESKEGSTAEYPWFIITARKPES